MTQFLIIILSLIWLLGTLFRIYRQAHFYQIEEYMSQRYFRWQLQKIERLVPKRAFIAWFMGVALAVLLGESPNSILPIIILMLAGLIAVYPGSQGEVKKPFRRTQRATRLLISAMVSATIIYGILLLLVNQISLPNIKAIDAIVTSSIGLLVFILAGQWLMLGNVLMLPVESFMRQRFINRAKQVMETVHPKVIGITGSYGKTTTKNFLTEILNGRYRTYATPKSYNTMMGVCLAINNDMANDYSIEYFISEMGAYVPGEIARICELTPPDIGIMVEVGPQHLERFGSLENTAIAKYELIKALPPDGLGVFNWDNDYVREMVERGYPNNRIAVSKTLSLENLPPNPPRFIATDIQETLEGLRFLVTDTQTQEAVQFQTAVLGEHNVTNILLATAVAVHEGMKLRDVASRVRILQPAESRLVRQTTASGITIINDAYSANPKGVISALQVLGMHQAGKRLLITPGMIELGELQEQENQKLGKLATQYATDIILVGKEQTKPLQTGIQTTDFPPENVQVVDQLSEAVAWYTEHLHVGDTVLFLNDLPDTY